MHEQSDGKYILIGDSQIIQPNNTITEKGLVLARINPDGTLDASFSHDGVVFDSLDSDVYISGEGFFVNAGLPGSR